jgi:hypothetical protein
MEEKKEEKKGFIKKMFSVFKKKDEKKIEDKKITEEPIVKNERRVKNLADRTTEKATVRTAARTEGGMKKCPHCGSDLSSGDNVRFRSRQNNDRGSAYEKNNSDDEQTYHSCRLMIGNNLFPDTLTLSHDCISFQEGSLFSSKERRVNYREVTSVRVKKGILFYDVRIESRRNQPILLDGLWEDEAAEIKNTIHFLQKKGALDDESSSRRNREFDDE